MYAFENETPTGLKSYGHALWWTAMLLTSIGSDYFPQTAEGRLLCLLLAIYGFAVFGYRVATLSSFFVGRDAADKKSEIAGATEINALKNEIALLRQEIHALANRQS